MSGDGIGDPDGALRRIRHGDRTKPFAPPEGASHLDEIEAHVKRHFGACDTVWHEMISDLVHLDVLVVEPTEERPYYTLVTSGMSDLPMRVPDGSTDPRRVELVMRAMPPVPFDNESMRDEAVYWPVRHLKQLARMPHALDTWLAVGQTVSTDPPEPVAPGIDFCAFGCLELLDPAARRLRAQDGTEIAFLQVVPLYREELDWKLAEKRPGALDVLFTAEILRCAMAERPRLGEPGPAAWADVGSPRGRRIVLAIAVGLGVLGVLDAAASYADLGKLRISRCGLTVMLAWYLTQGSAWARWIVVALQTIGVVAGIVLFVQKGWQPTWLQLQLAVASPVWLASAVLLAFAPSVRAWFAAHRPPSKR